MAKDIFHDLVKDALVMEGWQITHDPFSIDYGEVQMQIDLGAERLLAAERGAEKIAVEIKLSSQIYRGGGKRISALPDDL